MKKIKFISLAFMQQVKEPTNVISIGGQGEAYKFACEHKRVLRLEFDDIEGYVGPEYHNFDMWHATQILDFADNCSDEDILVHCHAGISRSAAVAKFLNEHMGYFLDLSYPSTSDLSMYNKDVYRQLFIKNTDRKIGRGETNPKVIYYSV